MEYIQKVNIDDNYQMELELSGGGTIHLDYRDRLDTVRFGPLRDEAFFRKVVTDGQVLRWGNEIELSLQEAMDMEKKH